MRNLIVFDLDETLVDIDTGMQWHEFLVERQLITRPGFLEEDQEMMRLYELGQMEVSDYVRFSLVPLEQYTATQVDQWVEQFVEERVRSRVYPQALERIKAIQDSGDELMIISATVSFLVQPIARMLGIDQSIGVDLVRDQHYRNAILGIPSFREGKVTRLQQWLDNTSEDFAQIHFYSDSINDRPLLEQADQAFVVNPCALLRPLAEQRQWTVLNWSHR